MLIYLLVVELICGGKGVVVVGRVLARHGYVEVGMGS